MVFTEASPRSWQLFRIQLLMKRLQLHSEITQVFLVAPNLLFRTFFNFPGVIFNRRRMLDYDTFDSFTTDQMYCCFVQYIFKTSGGTDDEEFGLWLSGRCSRKNVSSQDRHLLQEGENGNNPYSHYLQIISSLQTKLSEMPAYTSMEEFPRQKIRWDISLTLTLLPIVCLSLFALFIWLLNYELSNLCMFRIRY